MRIGLDFDNTIVCYDQAIQQLADELFHLPEEVPRTKLGLRDYLRCEGREAEWTVFQGELYGPGMRYAQPFEGATATMQQLIAEGHDLAIVSHRSRWPYEGRRHDLHNAAQEWIATRLRPAGIFCSDREPVYFMESKHEKICRIAELGCAVFLDDLPELLCSSEFPDATTGILFKPGDPCLENIKSISNWSQLIYEVRKIA
jgi:hypothetical protein